jgi:hypothetical protein
MDGTFKAAAVEDGMEDDLEDIIGNGSQSAITCAHLESEAEL